MRIIKKMRTNKEKNLIEKKTSKNAEKLLKSSEKFNQSEGVPLKKMKLDSPIRNEPEYLESIQSQPRTELASTDSYRHMSIASNIKNVDVLMSKRKCSADSELDVSLAKRQSSESSQTVSSSKSGYLSQGHSDFKHAFKYAYRDQCSYPSYGTEFSFERNDFSMQDGDWQNSSFEAGKSPESKPYINRLEYLADLYARYSNREIIYNGALYLQSLSNKQAEYSKTDRHIEDYFDQRKAGLTKLLEKF